MFRLPDGWSRPSKLDDFVVIGGVKIHRAGVAATAPTGDPAEIARRLGFE